MQLHPQNEAGVEIDMADLILLEPLLWNTSASYLFTKYLPSVVRSPFQDIPSTNLSLSSL